jgi:hypothetical protein
MNGKKSILLIATLILIGSSAGFLAHLRTNQKLGKPAVKTSSIGDPIRLQVELPDHLPGYQSTNIPIQEIVLNYLPKDTSFGQKVYTAQDGFQALVNVVLMGTDRTSIHKPEICLAGQGWQVDEHVSGQSTVSMERPFAYDLPVMKLIANQTLTINGQPVPTRGVYVYWFVAQNQYTATHWKRMWWMFRDVFRTGVLQRWAYVTYFSICAPGQEDATYERMKKLIAASVPEFQLVPSQPVTATALH